MPLFLNFIIQMSLFLKTSYEQSKTLVNCLGETLQLVECLDSLNTDLMQRYSVQGQKHPIASVCLFRSAKIREKKRSVCLDRMVQRSTGSYYTGLFQVGIAPCMAMD